MIDRRTFLALMIAGALARRAQADSRGESRRASYVASVAILYGLLRFELNGTIDEWVDPGGGRYEVRISGQGTGISNRIESSGMLRDGRWTPLRTYALFVVQGRESRSEVSYEHTRRVIEYHSRSETFFLRRVRLAEDVLPVPAGMHVDDVISATLNYADDRWGVQPEGTLVTHVVRRRRSAREGPDDVETAYRAELVPFVLKITPEPGSGNPTALFDLTRFSSWARETQPARIVFGRDRRPELITSSLILGTSITIRVGADATAPAS